MLFVLGWMAAAEDDANSARVCWPDLIRRSMFIVVGFCSTIVTCFREREDREKFFLHFLERGYVH